MLSYWKQQTADKPLFPNLLWSKPEQKSQSGKLGLIGGNSLSFLAVANAYQSALKAGIGEVKTVLPDSLKKTLGGIDNATFAPTNPSGGLANEALESLSALLAETDGLLLIGDAGKNHETQVLYESFLRQNTLGKPIILTRDAIDLTLGIMNEIITKPEVAIIASFSQLQKIFQSVYYPIILVHSMQTSKLVEALHKFTLTNPLTIAIFHDDQFLVAKNGEVVSTVFSQPTEIWQGSLPAKVSSWIIWNPLRPLEATITALV